jgi:hypothetical protein
MTVIEQKVMLSALTLSAKTELVAITFDAL